MRRQMTRPGSIVTKALSRLLILAAVLIFAGAVAAAVGPRLLGWQGVVVLSGSMEPALKVGGLIFVDTRIDATRLEVGDIVTFRNQQGSMITHRIVGVEQTAQGPLFATKGDATSNRDDQLLKPADVTGKTVLALPHAGRWSQWLRDGNNLFLVLWPAAGLIVLLEALNIVRLLRAGRSMAR